MRKLSKLFAGAATMAAAAALVAGTVTTASAAPNDPPKGVTPQSFDIVGVGSNTTEYVMDQISVDYNKTLKVHNANHPWFFSWDAVPPGVNKPGHHEDLAQGGLPGYRSAERLDRRPHRAGPEPVRRQDRPLLHRLRPLLRRPEPEGPEGGPGRCPVRGVRQGRDHVDLEGRGSNAPASLTKAQLVGIFTCKTTNWKQVGGKAGAIKVYLPQPGSGTLSTWEKFMGITTLGSCVSQAPEENEGTFAGFTNPNAIFIYSIGAYVSQKYHSAACGAKPKAGQNAFGCNVTGVLTLGKISGVAPIARTRRSTLPSRPASSAPCTTSCGGPRRLLTTSTSASVCSSPPGRCTVSCAQARSRPRTSQTYGFIPTATCGSTS